MEVVKEVDFGVYLNGDEDGEILLPKRYVPEGCVPGDMLNVFIYLDMDERLVATTLQPYAQVGRSGWRVRLSGSGMGQPVRGVLELGAYERLVCALSGTEGKDGKGRQIHSLCVH